MKQYTIAGVLLAGGIAFAYVLHAVSAGHSFPLIDTRGSIAEAQRNLIIAATFLMLTVVLPVLCMTLVISWRYRATNTKARYTPQWDHNTLDEAIWWAVPCVIVAGLAFLTVRSSYALDPWKPIESAEATTEIQVIALNWKWLFIYPEERIATLSHVVFPAGAPVRFHITADAPMNSFWIPQLGGQIYAMPGMETQLHLIADEAGEFRGSSANFSGEGFADMRFVARAVPASEYRSWVESVRASGGRLSHATYAEIATPSSGAPERAFGETDPGLFDDIVMKYMMPPAGASGHSMMHN